MVKSTPPLQLSLDFSTPAPGLCQCGCNERTGLATSNHTKFGYTIGEPLRFIHGHRSRLPRKKRPMPDVPQHLCACGCGEPTERITESWARAGLVRGEWNRYIKGHARRKTPHEYVVEDRGFDTPCWIWTRGGGNGRYGVARGGQSAHRMYYEERYGPIPDGYFLDHRCRQPSCVNPEHTEPVPPAENTRRCRLTKLSADQVRAILASPLNNAQAAKQHGVNETTIRDIRRGRTWKDITNPDALSNTAFWYVYALCEPDTGDVRYLGKSNDPEYRFRAHCKPGRAQGARQTWVRALRARGLRPALRILAEVATDKEVRAQEKALIAQYRAQEADLLNVDGIPSRRRLAPDTIAAIQADAAGGASAETLAVRYNIGRVTINRVVRGSIRSRPLQAAEEPIPTPIFGWGADHRFRTHPELQARGSSVVTSKLTEEQVREMRSRYDAGGIGTPELGRMYNVSTTNAWSIVKRHSWKHVL